MDRNLLVLSGPSGIGKTYLVSILSAYGFIPVVMTTTRKLRVGEENGVDYEFLSHEAYMRGISEANDFFMDNHFLGNHYGIRRSAVRSVWDRCLIPVLVIYVGVIDQVVSEFPFAKKVFLYPSSLDIIKERLSLRDGNMNRLADVQNELRLIDLPHYRRYYDAIIQVEGNNVFHIVAAILDLFN